MSKSSCLVADIGGTRARFALLDEAGIPGDIRILDVADHAGPYEAINAYLDKVGQRQLSAVALAIAAPVGNDSVRLTNADWVFSCNELRKRLGIKHSRLLNDFTALALALPHLPANELRQVGGGTARAFAPKAVLGPGTGLGVSGLLADRGRWLPLAGEGGHVTLAPADARESEILTLAWQEMPHISAERLVSGCGMPFLHRLVAAVDGFPATEMETPEIVASALDGDAHCRATINTFCAMLGTVAGNLALTLGAQGGVYIAGGIVPRLGNLFELSPFRARFEAKGRFSPYLASIPAYVILSPAPALIGAAHALSEIDTETTTSSG